MTTPVKRTFQATGTPQSGATDSAKKKQKKAASTALMAAVRESNSGRGNGDFRFLTASDLNSVIASLDLSSQQALNCTHRAMVQPTELDPEAEKRQAAVNRHLNKPEKRAPSKHVNPRDGLVSGASQRGLFL